MQVNDGPGALELAAAIERYLQDHPQAADSVAGIAQWWLPNLTYSVDEVQIALDHLVRKEVLISTQSANGNVLYCAKQKHDKRGA